MYSFYWASLCKPASSPCSKLVWLRHAQKIALKLFKCAFAWLCQTSFSCHVKGELVHELEVPSRQVSRILIHRSNSMRHCKDCHKMHHPKHFWGTYILTLLPDQSQIATASPAYPTLLSIQTQRTVFCRLSAPCFKDSSLLLCMIDGCHWWYCWQWICWGSGRCCLVWAVGRRCCRDAIYTHGVETLPPFSDHVVFGSREANTSKCIHCCLINEQGIFSILIANVIHCLLWGQWNTFVLLPPPLAPCQPPSHMKGSIWRRVMIIHCIVFICGLHLSVCIISVSYNVC